MTRIANPLKWHGGKHYLASRIIGLMPPHTHYVEPFAGGLSVLLAKDPEGVSEVVNDLDGELVNFWSVLAHPVLFEKMRRILEATPFAEPVFDQAMLKAAKRRELWPDRMPDGIDRVSRAVDFFIRCRQSLAGRMDCFAPLSRKRTRRGMNEQASAWINAVDGLPAVHARLCRVVILNRDARDVIRSQDGPETLFYCDPPYLPDTRSAPNVYAHEMTAQGHCELLDLLARVKGKVILSGYDNPLYASHLKDWNRYAFDLPNNAAGGTEKRRMTEVVWTNFAEVG